VARVPHRRSRYRAPRPAVRSAACPGRWAPAAAAAAPNGFRRDAREVLRAGSACPGSAYFGGLTFSPASLTFETSSFIAIGVAVPEMSTVALNSRATT